MLILMVRFWRSTKLVETCLKSGLPSDERLLGSHANGGAVAGLRGLGNIAVNLHEPRIINVGSEPILDGGKIAVIAVRG
jgi:hypothetical protein